MTINPSLPSSKARLNLYLLYFQPMPDVVIRYSGLEPMVACGKRIGKTTHLKIEHKNGNKNTFTVEIANIKTCVDINRQRNDYWCSFGWTIFVWAIKVWSIVWNSKYYSLWLWTNMFLLLFSYIHLYSFRISTSHFQWDTALPWIILQHCITMT